MKKKIIIIDDEPLMSNLMKEIVEEEGDLEVARITTTKEDFLAAAAQEPFDIGLIDISVGGREGGMEILQALKEASVPWPAVMFSAHDETMYAPKCLKAGARGYVSKEYVCADLVRGLREVLEGGMFVSSPNGKDILERFRRSTAGQPQ